MPDLLKGVETPGAAVSIRAEDAAQVVTKDDIHKKGTVDEVGVVENVITGLRGRVIRVVQGGISWWWRGVVGGWEGTNGRCVGTVLFISRSLVVTYCGGGRWWSERRYRMIGDRIESVQTL